MYNPAKFTKFSDFWSPKHALFIEKAGAIDTDDSDKKVINKEWI